MPPLLPYGPAIAFSGLFYSSICSSLTGFTFFCLVLLFFLTVFTCYTSSTGCSSGCGSCSTIVGADTAFLCFFEDFLVVTCAREWLTGAVWTAAGAAAAAGAGGVADAGGVPAAGGAPAAVAAESASVSSLTNFMRVCALFSPSAPEKNPFN